MISALNFKPFDQGSIRGFLDLRYHGLTIKGVRLMSGNNGLWLAFPQQKGEHDGETRYFDQVYLTPPEADHVRRMVLFDIVSQGHIESANLKPSPSYGDNGRATHQTPEGEDLSDYYPDEKDDGIPF